MCSSDLMAVRQKVITILKQVFESFGFQPLETPTLEYATTLLGKYGSEADKLVYTFSDQGRRQVGLLYDLTVPVSKVLALYRNRLPLPFKRYQIQNVFRAEKPQKGRYREFTQCDIDTFGIASPLADAEIVQVIYQALKELKLGEFIINLNSRTVLGQILKQTGIEEKSQQLSVLQSVDKLDKKTEKEVKKELLDKKLTTTQIDQLLAVIKKAQPDEDLKLIFDFLAKAGIPANCYRFNPKMVRGLDYYTRAIFETVITKPKIGSITGGGRYDQLVSQLGGPKITGTGTTIGLDRICDVIVANRLWPDLIPCPTKILVTVFSPELQKNSQALATLLRYRNRVNTEVYLDPAVKLEKQLKYADKKGIEWVAVIGPDEMKNRTVSLKNLKTRTQVIVAEETVVEIINGPTT